jgi:dihydropteroate synthase
MWRLAHGRHLTVGPRARVMGILNVTPDSFSDGGRFDRPEAALAQAERMLSEGAAIIDIGGESTRPGASAVTAEEEQSRVLPVIELLAKRSEALISIDTYRASTARLAIEAGAHIVNDVWGLQREPAIAAVARETGAGLVIMHTGREREKADDVIADQKAFLGQSLEIARKAGIETASIVLDPGFGFAKNSAECIELMARFGELHAFDHAWLVGTSRKRFIGRMTGRDAAGRDPGTAATSLVLRQKGAAIFRVHDVAMNADALAVADAALSAERGEGGVLACLGLGGNIGDPAGAMAEALRMLDTAMDCAVRAVSPVYRTPPWGKTDQPDFLNACAVVETRLAPRALLRRILGVEQKLKRERNERWGPRTIDIDIVTYDDEIIDEPGLKIPHPRAPERAFVMVPLADIAPDVTIAGKSAAAHAKALGRAGMNVAVAGGDWWREAG